MIDMNTMLIFILMFAAGLALGLFYFTSLWRTVLTLPEAQKPAKLLIFSFIVRLAVILTAFYFLMDGHWERLVLTMIGFMVMKKILINRLGQPKAA